VWTKSLAFILALALIFDDAVAATKRCELSLAVQGPCILVKGTLKWWHSWPPFLRIESDNTIYGIWPPEHENAPRRILDIRPYSTRGTYLLCPLNKVTNLPYDQRSIELYCIEKATIKERELKLGRKIVWVKLEKPLTLD
jgi:hypothetical protein